MGKYIIGGLFVVGIMGLFVAQYNFEHRNSADIKIGAALGLTGDCAEWGEGELKAAQLAIDESNSIGGVAGKKIQLSIEDTQCNPKGTFNATKKLVEVNNVEAIIGPTWGDSFTAGYTVINAQHVVSVAPSAVLEALSANNISEQYSFSTWFPAAAEVESVQTYAEKIGAKKFATVYDNEPYGVAYGTDFAKNADMHGISIIDQQALPVGYYDFRTIIVKLKKLGIDGVFVSLQTPEGQAKFMRQTHELGLRATIFTSSQIEDTSLIKAYGGVMEGAVYAYPQSTTNYDAFVKKYHARYGTDPQGPSAANAYDAARVIIAGLQANSAKGTALTDAIEAVVLQGTVADKIEFDKTHQLKGLQYEIKSVHDGQFVTIE